MKHIIDVVKHKSETILSGKSKIIYEIMVFDDESNELTRVVRGVLLD